MDNGIPANDPLAKAAELAQFIVQWEPALERYETFQKRTANANATKKRNASATRSFSRRSGYGKGDQFESAQSKIASRTNAVNSGELSIGNRRTNVLLPIDDLGDNASLD